MAKQKNYLTYMTTPQYENVRRRGFRLVRKYRNYSLFEKMVDGKPLYRECFSNFELYGADWAINRQGVKRGVNRNTKQKPIF